MIAGLVVTAILLTKNNDKVEDLTGTVVKPIIQIEQMADLIIDWDSSEKVHEKQASNKNVKCSITVNDSTYEYDDFAEGWIALNTTYKNKNNVEFTLYADWEGDLSGSLGRDDTCTAFDARGGIIITDRDVD